MKNQYQKKSKIRNDTLTIRGNYLDFENKNIVDEFEHEVGDINCNSCFYPPKKCVCGGLIHNQLYEEMPNCDQYFWYACDKCGDKYKEALSPCCNDLIFEETSSGVSNHIKLTRHFNVCSKCGKVIKELINKNEVRKTYFKDR